MVNGRDQAKEVIDSTKVRHRSRGRACNGMHPVALSVPEEQAYLHPGRAAPAWLLSQCQQGLGL